MEWATPNQLSITRSFALHLCWCNRACYFRESPPSLPRTIHCIAMVNDTGHLSKFRPRRIAIKELSAHINDEFQEDLLGFHGESPDDLRPVYKMQKPENPTEKKATLKTLLLTKDKNSGKSYILINNKLVPIRNIPLSEGTVKTLCVSGSSKIKKNETSTPKMYFESKIVKLKAGVSSMLKNEEQVSDSDNRKVNGSSDKLKSISKLESNIDRKIKHSHARCNLALSKHKNSLLDIIQNLRRDNLYLKTGMHVARKKSHLLKSKFSMVEMNARKHLDEIKTLKETIATLKQFHKPKTCEVGLQTDVDCKKEVIKQNCIENNYNIKQDYLATELLVVENEVGEELAGEHRTAICSSPYDDLIQILRNDVNMGVNLKKPKIIAINSGNGVQFLNGPVGINTSSRMMFWMCYKMCDKQNEEGDFPIHIAIMNNDNVAVRRQCQALKLRGLPIDLENGYGQTPLQLAIIHKVSASIVADLKSFNANFFESDSSGNNIFHLAAMNQYLKELDKNDILEKTDHINAFNYQGYTPLMLAVIHKNAEDAEVLIKMEADLNKQDKNSGKTALFHAVESNSLDLVNLLMVHGADTSKRNFTGHTVQDTIAEIEVSAMLKKLFNELEDNSPDTRSRKRIRDKGPLKIISKRVKI